MFANQSDFMHRGTLTTLLLLLLGSAPMLARAEINLPHGFEATVFADSVGIARHVAVADNGDVYVALNQPQQGKGIVALRDTDNDGSADQKEYFGDVSGTGIALHNGYLYFGTNTEVVRWQRQAGELIPSGQRERVVVSFARRNQHAAKPITFDDSGHLYVNVGAPSNACQEKDRTAGSPGQRPCPLLEQFGGIWRYDADKLEQKHPQDGTRYVTGVRNAVALDWSEDYDALYLVQHGRDQLDSMYPELFTTEERIRLPAEEFHRVTEAGSNLGWPYTYWDPNKEARMVAPEYGGDGDTVADNPDYQEPLIGFPAHWGPNDLLFYSAEQFPQAYRGGAFIAFHGSWNRQPQPQAGFQVAFVPMASGQPAGDWSTFADGFTGKDKLMDPGKAEHRPMGLAQGPDGALYITDSIGGRVWRITYAGD